LDGDELPPHEISEKKKNNVIARLRTIPSYFRRADDGLKMNVGFGSFTAIQLQYSPMAASGRLRL
jgi:hypothetical protein